MVGRGHEAHADRATQNQAIEIRIVGFVGDTGNPRKNREEGGKQNQQSAYENCKRIVD